jgi:hypothetical protein
VDLQVRRCDEPGLGPGATASVAKVRFDMAVDLKKREEIAISLEELPICRVEDVPSRTLKPTLFQSAMENNEY